MIVDGGRGKRKIRGRLPDAIARQSERYFSDYLLLFSDFLVYWLCPSGLFERLPVEAEAFVVVALADVPFVAAEVRDVEVVVRPAVDARVAEAVAVFLVVFIIGYILEAV